MPEVALSLLALLAAGVLAGQVRERRARQRLLSALRDGGSRAPAAVSADSLGALPVPVSRYLRLALHDAPAVITRAELLQSGVLRESPTARRWAKFSARHSIVPPSPGFVWDARVELPLGAHVRVLDGYVGGSGSGRVSLLSTLKIAEAAGRPELDAGALHRYLAESVWFPSALLPQSGVTWTPLDDRRALASLTDGPTTVTLEFRFNGAGEVAGIYTPARWASSGGGYRELPWEGHFRDYREHCGIRIPFYGEVGWWIDGWLELVWKGELRGAAYELAA